MPKFSPIVTLEGLIEKNCFWILKIWPENITFFKLFLLIGLKPAGLFNHLSRTGSKPFLSSFEHNHRYTYAIFMYLWVWPWDFSFIDTFLRLLKVAEKQKRSPFKKLLSLKWTIVKWGFTLKIKMATKCPPGSRNLVQNKPWYYLISVAAIAGKIIAQ